MGDKELPPQEKPGSGQHKGIGEKKKQPELSRLPVSFFGR